VQLARHTTQPSNPRLISRHQQQQPQPSTQLCASFSSRSSYREQDYYKQRRKRKDPCPFQVLGLVTEAHRAVLPPGAPPRDILFVTVKKQFLKIAMAHHPDTLRSSNATAEQQEASQELFIRARKAFEAIVEGPDGWAILRSESDKHAQEEEMDRWFKAETGHDMPFMDPKTMKEVAEMTEKVGGGMDGGLDRDGGMWTLARMVTSTVRSGGSADDLLRLEAGASSRGDGVLRRRRKR